MQPCIVDAMLKEERAFLSEAATLVLLRDESKGMLLARARMCTVSLQHRTLFLGLCKQSKGADAFDISASTAQIIDRFTGHPRLSNHFRQCCEAVCVDAASSEVKSARLMKTEPAGNPLAPNLKCLIRDRAHASRRLVITHPWKADAAVDELTDRWIMGSRSIAQRIHHSFLFSAWYKERVKQLARGPWAATTSLRAARHRFETWSRPLAQFIMILPAVIRTAQDISVVRQGREEAAGARAFLTELTPQRVLLMAMLADASDESMLLTHVCLMRNPRTSGRKQMPS